MITPAYYPINNTNISEGERAYLRQLASNAATQDLAEDLRGRVRAVTASCVGAATVVVGLRFLARRWQATRIGMDDWAMAAALVVLVGNLIMNIMLVKQGLGLHSGALTLEELQRLSQTMVGAEILYATGANLSKIAVLMLYLRIFPFRSVRLGGYLCGFFSTAWNVACILLATLQCMPLKRLWMPWLEGSCIDPAVRQMGVSIPNILCGIVVLWLPMPQLLVHKLSPVKWALIGMTYLLGGCAVFICAYRFRTFLLYTPGDMSYSLADGCLWNVAEISSVIVVGCLPTLSQFVGMVWKSAWHPFDGESRTELEHDGYKNRSKKPGKFRGFGWNPLAGLGGKQEKDTQAMEAVDFSLVPKHLVGQIEVSVRYSPTPRAKGRVGGGNGISSDSLPLTAIRQRTEVEWKVERRKSILSLFKF